MCDEFLFKNLPCVLNESHPSLYLYTASGSHRKARLALFGSLILHLFLQAFYSTKIYKRKEIYYHETDSSSRKLENEQNPRTDNRAYQ